MKKLLIILTAFISFNLMASTTMLGCKDQSSDSTYLVRVATDSSFILITPVARDSTALSTSKMMLNLRKDVSSKLESIYEGMNAKKNVIIAEIKNGQLINGNKTDMNIIFSNDDSSSLDQETILNCNVSVKSNK